MNEEEMKNAINAVKADSYDQMTALNTQLTNLSQQLNQQNMLLQEVVKIAAPNSPNLTIEQLLDTLRGAFQITAGESTDD